MNKRFLCGLLAGVMAFGSVFSVAGCKPKEDGGNNNGDGNNSSIIEPGTVITDEKTMTDIYNALSEAKLGGFTYSASANLSVTEGNNTQVQKIMAEGAIAHSDSTVQADVFSYLTSSDSKEDGGRYMFFLRDAAAYSAFAKGEGKEEDRYSELKTQLKAKEDPLMLEKIDLGGFGALQTTTVMKLAQNVSSLFEGVITKTEGGFSLKYDVMTAAKKFLEGAEPLGAAVDENQEITLGGLFSQKYLKDTLDKLLKGITAKELLSVANGYLPAEITEALPEATEGQTAMSYVEGLLRSGAFYKALAGEEEPWSQWKTFSEVPLTGVIGGFTGEEFTFGDVKLKEEIGKLKEELESMLTSYFLELIGLNEGELKDEDIDLTLGFEFDNDKKLLGFSLDGLITGSRTVTQPEGGEQGEGTQPQPEGSEQGDGTQPQPEGGEQGEGTEPPAKADNGAVKTVVRGTVTIAASSASAPEIFDLTGCKYYNEDGDPTTIKAAK